GLFETATMTSSKSEAARTMISMWPLWTGSNDPGHTARCIVVNVADIATRCYVPAAWLPDSSVAVSSNEVDHSFTVSACINHIDTLGPGWFSRFIGGFQHEQPVVHQGVEYLSDRGQEFGFVDTIWWIGDHQIPAGGCSSSQKALDG